MAAVLMLRGSARLLYKHRRVRAASVAMVCSRAMASKTPVGFIGLGNMGNPMAKNLVKHGYPVVAFDIFPEACKEFQDSGAQVMDSPADVAERADRIITMLPSSPNAVEVYTGANGILKKVKKGSLLIDSSTIDPTVSKELAKAVEKMGAVFMDAPVSGATLRSWLPVLSTAQRLQNLQKKPQKSKDDLLQAVMDHSVTENQKLQDWRERESRICQKNAAARKKSTKQLISILAHQADSIQVLVAMQAEHYHAIPPPTVPKLFLLCPNVSSKPASLACRFLPPPAASNTCTFTNQP
ncbi:3-hydroxyisobutyrate dehydrogenase, mitochondrial isoform X2 [Gopherus flavomarginatus]|uniref:3-hydroxyisobutyrate dehydrogenase, mitochondrial isoform X2 n=1 Tax=Gopherus flavomarginatus TaxID=286002 RepID=UPI0021CC2024|nr:3-hydroxyisobutyrate dehydrogenase, mitochondrial isoform X2 [Gopherus flavomarginatus]